MPWFVNWDDYKTTFEQEAAKILGHPVQVLGSANASILPSPSLSFTDVRVGDPGEEPMMTVERFDVTVELTPLLQGEIRVTSMRLEQPSVRVAIDETGMPGWLNRDASAEALNPDRIVLSNVAVSDGSLTYSDARNGVSLAFGGITAAVEARSLAGPWKIDGSYIEDGAAVPFSIGSGRLLDDGTIRVTAHASPRQWPIELSTDGVLSNDPAMGVGYAGTYIVSELVENTTGEVVEDSGSDGPTGWRSEGAFSLSSDRLVIDTAVLSNGPADRPSSVAGALTLTFGDGASFDASLEARQLDLDRTLGGGPNQPVNVAAAGEGLVTWLRGLPLPPIDGQISFDVPAIVVGGSVIQDVSFVAAPAGNGWALQSLRARLPGQAAFNAEGVLRTDRNVGFTGSARLAVSQPTTFASWWRGRSGGGNARQLSAFDVAGDIDVAAGRLSLDNVAATVGGAAIAGRFAWTATDSERRLGADLTADSIDFDQLEALAQLLAGRDLNGLDAFADNYSLRLSADVVRYNAIDMRNVAVDAAYADDTLNVVQFAVGDLDGASFRVTSGRIDNLTTSPQGHLDARLEATSIDGLASIAGRIFPGAGLVEWLGRTADVTLPAYVDARIAARPAEEGGISATLSGVAGATTFDASLGSASPKPAEWASSDAQISLTLQSPDSSALLRQAGLDAIAIEADPGAMIDVRASGAPDTGLATEVTADVAGMRVSLTGDAIALGADAPSATGTFDVSSDDVAVPLSVVRVTVPEAGNSQLAITGRLNFADAIASLTWHGGRVGDRTTGGDLKISRNGERGLRVDGSVTSDVVDLGWLASLGLGFSPWTEQQDGEAWSTEAFAPPSYGQLSGKLSLSAGQMNVAPGLAVANAQFAVALQPQRIDVDLASGDIAGGKATGGFSIHNVDGNAAVGGQFNVSAAALESFVWRQDERALATGLFDLSTSFEATGRSPAALVASMTGGGVVSVSDAEVRSIDLAPAVRQIIRASDLGQEFTEDSLRITLAEQIGTNPLKVGEAGGAFTLAAGVARLRGTPIRATNAAASGNVVIDLNTMTLDSDWSFEFDPGDDKVEGADPRVGVIFRGPLASPSRTIDALAFGSYLNTRREARILEVIALEDASRAERVRFDRLLVKLDQDKARAERLAQEAAERAERRRTLAIASAAAAFQLHTEREIIVDERQSAALALSATEAAALRDAAEEVARAAAASAEAARGEAQMLADRLPALVAAGTDAAAAAAQAAEALVVGEAAATATAAAAAEAAAGADQAEAGALAAMTAETQASEAADAAAEARDVAEADLSSAMAAFDAAAATLEAARAENVSAQAALDAAGAAVSGALGANEDAAAALQAAEAAHAERSAAAEVAGREQAEAAQLALTTDAERARVQTEVNIASAAAEKAAADQDSAAARVGDMESQLAAAEKALADAAAVVSDATRLAEIMASDPTSDQQTVTSARGLVTAAKLRQAARQADVDRLRVEVSNARADLTNSERSVADAAASLEAARSEVAEAVAKAEAADDAAKAAMAANAAALNALAEAVTVRDAAIATVGERQEGAREAGAAFDAAQERAVAAADAVEAAEAAMVTATAKRDEATAIATAKAGEADGYAAQWRSAAAERDDAMAAAQVARQNADNAAAAAREAGDKLAELRDTDSEMRAAAETAHAALTDAEAAAQAAEDRAVAAEASAADAARIASERAADAARAEARLASFNGEDDVGLAEVPVDGALLPLTLAPAQASGVATP